MSSFWRRRAAAQRGYAPPEPQSPPNGLDGSGPPSVGFFLVAAADQTPDGGVTPSPGAPSYATLPEDAALPRVRHAWARIALVGLLAGFTAGLFGVGGGIVIVPGLAALAGFRHKLATGTSLTAIIPIAMAGVAGYASGGEVDWPAALCVSLGAIVGAVVGTRLLTSLRTSWLQLAFAASIIIGAVRMFVGEADAAGRPELTVAMAAAMVLLGVTSGLIAGLLGVGGGIIIVPALSLLFGIPHVLAKGTSLAVIVPTAIMGTIRNRRAGLTALGPAAIVGGAGVVSALVAARVSLILDATLAQALFAGLLVVTAARLVRDGLRSRRTDLGEA